MSHYCRHRPDPPRCPYCLILAPLFQHSPDGQPEPDLRSFVHHHALHLLCFRPTSKLPITMSPKSTVEEEQILLAFDRGKERIEERAVLSALFFSGIPTSLLSRRVVVRARLLLLVPSSFTRPGISASVGMQIANPNRWEFISGYHSLRFSR